jgi:hypothetical protein
MDAVNNAFGYGLGPRATMGLGLVFFAIGALLLRPVVEVRREIPSVATVVGAAAIE